MNTTALIGIELPDTSVLYSQVRNEENSLYGVLNTHYDNIIMVKNLIQDYTTNIAESVERYIEDNQDLVNDIYLFANNNWEHVSSSL